MKVEQIFSICGREVRLRFSKAKADLFRFIDRLCVSLRLNYGRRKAGVNKFFTMKSFSKNRYKPACYNKNYTQTLAGKGYCFSQRKIILSSIIHKQQVKAFHIVQMNSLPSRLSRFFSQKVKSDQIKAVFFGLLFSILNVILRLDEKSKTGKNLLFKIPTL